MQRAQTGSAVNCSAGVTDNSSSSACSNQQSIISVTGGFAAHSEICTTNVNPPQIPTCCCMSGCANCVYIQYAMEMANYFKVNGTTALKVIDAIEDETLKAFLKVEIEHILLKQK